MKNSIVLFGAGGHATSCIEAIESSNKFNITGLIAGKFDNTQEVLGYPVIGTDDSISKLASKSEFALIAVGQIKSADVRIGLFNLAVSLGFSMPVVIASSAYVSQHSEIKDGTVVLNGAVINANAKIGKNCIINSQALVEHDVRIGNHTHLSTGVKLNGSVHVGSRTFIGSGAIVKDGVFIGDDCIIGAGSVVLRDVQDGDKVIGIR